MLIFIKRQIVCIIVAPSFSVGIQWSLSFLFSCCMTYFVDGPLLLNLACDHHLDLIKCCIKQRKAQNMCCTIHHYATAHSIHFVLRFTCLLCYIIVGPLFGDIWFSDTIFAISYYYTTDTTDVLITDKVYSTIFLGLFLDNCHLRHVLLKMLESLNIFTAFRP